MSLSEERKALQKAGLLPEWFTTAGWQIIKKKYLSEGESYRDRVETLASTLAKHTSNPKMWKLKFFDIVWKGWLSPATPVLSNTGTDKGYCVSCSGQYFADSIDSIYSNKHETACLTKEGFGTSGDLSDIRPRGSLIKGLFKSTGVVPVIKGLVTDMQYVAQGSARRGSFASYINIEHGDFHEVCKLLEHEPDDLNIGWIIKDSFISRLESGDKEAIKRYQEVMQLKMITGKGYFWFADKANRHMPEVYANHGLTHKASNLCIAGGDRVLSQYGYLTAEELYEIGGDLTLFDGEKEVKSSPMKLRDSHADTYRITLDNGLEQVVTEYHGMAVVKDGSVKRVEAKDLRLGDKIAIQTNKGMFGSKNMVDEAFLLGLYQSDGTQSKDMIYLQIWENDFDILDEVQAKFNKIHYKYGCDKYEIVNQNGPTGKVRSRLPAQFHEACTDYSDVRKRSLNSKTLKKALDFEKGYVPSWIWESDEATQWSYIRGLLIADGTVFVSKSKGNPIQLNYADINKEFLKELQLLFNNLGLQSSIRKSRNAGRTLMPDGKGGKKYYDTKDCWRLIVGNKTSCLEIEKKTGFLSRKGISIEDREYQDNTKKSYKVTSIEYAGKQAVYCPTVYTEEHIFVSQGVKTFNCTEIVLPSDENHSYTCVLSSLNLTYFDDWKDTDAVETATIFLDCVVSEFLEQARGKPGMEKTVRFTEKFRALGLGVMGFHTYLQDHNMSWGSLEAMYFNREVFKLIQERALKASKELGALSLEMIPTGRRNASLMAIAPTMSTALIMGGVSQGIEPVSANVYVQSSAAGEVYRINPSFLKLLKKKGLYNEKIIKSVEEKKGSVQHLDCLSEEEKLVFRTAFELDQEVILRLASQRQQFIDQGQSLNLFITSNTPEEEISRLHEVAIKDKNILGLYYLRSIRQEVDIKPVCEGCDG